jgi:2-dehydropantoate 2-reductase
VKSFDLAGVLPRLADALSGRTIIIPLLNGVDAYERIREKISDARILPACAYVGTHIESPGRIRQDGGACKIVLGKDPKAPHFEPEWVFDLFRKSGIKFEWRDDARPELWKKFMFISAFGLVTAASSRTLGGVMADGKSSGRARSIMREIEAVARAAGITLPDSIVEDSYNRVREFPFETKTSFQRDFERSDKPDERDLFAGTILRMGAQLGVPTPATRDTLDSLNGLKPLPPGYT